MNVLVIGSGGREHAIIKAIKKNPLVKNLYAAPGNGGITQDATCLSVNSCDIPGICALCTQRAIDFVVVTPDDPLVAGLVDALHTVGIPAFGPSKAAAQIEGSKVYAKQFMHRYHIPTADYAVFDHPNDAISYLEQQRTYPVVIKADGLALGKGVLIAADLDTATAAVHTLMVEQMFGASGTRIVIEEFLTGPEVSVLTLCDSKTIIPMVTSMDHKRALDGDQGLNTGGMGAIAPNPYYTDQLANLCMETIFMPTMQGLNHEGRPFQGCLYFGLMLTPSGPKVIEYNCRFGDPETQAILPLLQTDLLTILQAVCNQQLAQARVEFLPHTSSACVVISSGGYPQKYRTGYPISGLDADDYGDGVTIYHAGTAYQNQRFRTSGGRVVGITAVADTLSQALNQAYAAVDRIQFQDKHFRTDIGTTALKQ